MKAFESRILNLKEVTMKLCMPTQGNKGLSETIYNHFGSSPYFTIYNTETKEIDVIANKNQHHEHGDCMPLAVIKDRQIDAVLTNGMGKRAVHSLNKGGVKVFLMEGTTVEEAIQKYGNANLKELSVKDACGGHGDDHGRHHHN